MSGGMYGPNGIGYASGFDGHHYVMIREDLLTDGFDIAAALIEFRAVRERAHGPLDHGDPLPKVDRMVSRKRRCAVYRFFDRAGRLLYVGKSIDPVARQKQHERRAWWGDVDTGRTTHEWFANERLALDAEDVAIRDENPVYNRVGGGRS